MARKKDTEGEVTEAQETKARLISVDLSPEVTAEIDGWAASHPLVNKSAVRDLVRAEAVAAANAATVGRVDEIVRKAL